MRTKVTEKTVYTWDELNDSAKDTARQEWSAFLWEDGSAQESMQMLFEGMAEKNGWENAGNLTYSLYSQGGEPCFDVDLPAVEVDGQTFYVTARSTHAGGGSHYFTYTVEESDEQDEPEYGTPEWDAYVALLHQAERSAREQVEAFASKLFRAMREEDEYMTNDEQMRETSEANGYEYTEDGHLA